MKLTDIMTTPPVTISGRATAANAALTMVQRGCGFLPVVEDGVAVGVVTGRDLATRLAARELHATDVNVRRVMSSPTLGLGVESDVEEACALMQERDVHRLVVTDDNGTLVGVVSLSDIAGHTDHEWVARTLRSHADHSSHVSAEFVISLPGQYLG